MVVWEAFHQNRIEVEHARAATICEKPDSTTMHNMILDGLPLILGDPQILETNLFERFLSISPTNYTKPLNESYI